MKYITIIGYHSFSKHSNPSRKQNQTTYWALISSTNTHLPPKTLVKTKKNDGPPKSNYPNPVRTVAGWAFQGPHLHLEEHHFPKMIPASLPDTRLLSTEFIRNESHRIIYDHIPKFSGDKTTSWKLPRRQLRLPDFPNLANANSSSSTCRFIFLTAAWLSRRSAAFCSCLFSGDGLMGYLSWVLSALSPKVAGSQNQFSTSSLHTSAQTKSNKVLYLFSAVRCFWGVNQNYPIGFFSFHSPIIWKALSTPTSLKQLSGLHNKIIICINKMVKFQTESHCQPMITDILQNRPLKKIYSTFCKKQPITTPTNPQPFPPNNLYIPIDSCPTSTVAVTFHRSTVNRTGGRLRST